MKVLLLISMLLGSHLSLAQIYVDQSATGTNDGSSWADAFTSLQDALDAATAGNDIWVAQGAYTADEGAAVTSGDRSASFEMKNEVGIYGGFNGTETTRAQRDWKSYPTILSGEIGDVDDERDNTYNIVRNFNTNSTAILDGFTIDASYNRAVSGSGSGSGGGMNNSNASPTINNCIFSNNIAARGSAVYGEGGSPVFTNCLFDDNNTTGKFAGSSIIYGTSQDTFINTQFVNNQSGNNGDDGAVFYKFSGGSVSAINCFISNNRAEIGVGRFNGANPSGFTNCTITNNVGIGTFQAAGVVNVLNGSQVTFTNSILWNNQSPGEQLNIISGTIEVSYSIYDDANENGTVTLPQGITDGGNNSDENPALVGGYRTTICEIPPSSAVDNGNSAAPDLSGIMMDIGGNPRVQNTAVDIGAFELPASPVFDFPDDIIYVNKNATGNNDGSSWINAYTSLHDAMYYTKNCGATAAQLWVAKGTYKTDNSGFISSGDRNLAFLLEDIEVLGGFVGNEPANYNLSNRDLISNETILSGNINSANSNEDNSYSVVKGEELNTVVLDGLTITGGYGDNFDDVGGGVHLNNNIFAHLNNLKIHGNHAEDGGGIFADTTDIIISNSVVQNNSARLGGGIFADMTDMAIVNSVVQNNTGSLRGGGIEARSSSSELTHVLIKNNSAQFGGGIVNAVSDLILTNTAIVNNMTINPSDSQGGGVYNVGSFSVTSTVTAYNSILYGNIAPDGAEIYNNNATATFSHSLIKDQHPAGPGNIDATVMGFDPLFVDEVGGDYRLQMTSPLVDAGDFTFLPEDEFDFDGDGDLSERIPLDLDGYAREMGVDVDIGPYEYGDLIFKDGF